MASDTAPPSPTVFTFSASKQNDLPSGQPRVLGQPEARMATTLYAAVECGDVGAAETVAREHETCSQYMKNPGGKLVDVRRANREGEFPLLVACAQGHMEMVSKRLMDCLRAILLLVQSGVVCVHSLGVLGPSSCMLIDRI
jgi:hypothetical protein